MPKPTFGTPPNPDHPLSASILSACWDVQGGSFLDGVAGNTWTAEGFAGDATFEETTVDGDSALVMPGVNKYLLNDTLAIPSDQVTILIEAVFEAGEGSAFGNLDPSNPARCQACIPYGDTVFFDFGGGDGANRVHWAPDPGWFGQRHRMIFSAGPDGLSIWADGDEVASSSPSVTRDANTVGFRLGSYHVYFNVMTLIAFAAWGRQLDDAEKAEISADPYAMAGPVGPEPPCGVFAAGGALIAVAG